MAARSRALRVRSAALALSAACAGVRALGIGITQSAWASAQAQQALGEPAAAGGAIGQEPQPALGAVAHHAGLERLAEEGAESILHRGDRAERLSGLLPREYAEKRRRWSIFRAGG